MIVENIQEEIANALRAKDSLRLAVIRMLLSELNYEKIRLQHKLTDNEELGVVAKEAKKRKEAITAFSQLKNERTEELKKKEGEELKILEEFLPEQVTDEELNQLISDTIKQLNAKTINDMGHVIGAVKQKVGAGADGAKIADVVRKKLNI